MYSIFVDSLNNLDGYVEKAKKIALGHGRSFHPSVPE